MRTNRLLMNLHFRPFLHRLRRLLIHHRTLICIWWPQVVTFESHNVKMYIMCDWQSHSHNGMRMVDLYSCTYSSIVSHVQCDTQRGEKRVCKNSKLPVPGHSLFICKTDGVRSVGSPPRRRIPVTTKSCLTLRVQRDSATMTQYW